MISSAESAALALATVASGGEANAKTADLKYYVRCIAMESS